MAARPVVLVSFPDVTLPLLFPVGSRKFPNFLKNPVFAFSFLPVLFSFIFFYSLDLLSALPDVLS